MIEFDVPEHEISRAVERASRMKFKKRASDTLQFESEERQKQMAIAGMVGEAAFQQWRKDAIHADTKDFDFVSKGLRIDIKSRSVSYQPKLHHDHAIPERDREQDHDILVFAAVKKDMTKVWLVGWSYKKDFFEKLAVKRKRGDEKIKDDGTVLKLKASNYEVTYSKLNGIHA